MPNLPYKYGSEAISDHCTQKKEFHLQGLRKGHMSRQPSATRQAVETAPPRILRVERRPCLAKKLETIQEEGDQGGQSRSFNVKPTTKTATKTAGNSKQFPSVVAN